MRVRHLAVDFDGTIVTHMYPQIGAEAQHAVRVLKRVMKAGHKIILWTCRENGGGHLEEAVQWMDESGIELHEVNETNPDEDFRSGDVRRKVLAGLYIDDRNIGIPKQGGTVDWLWVEHQLEAEGWFEKED